MTVITCSAAFDAYHGDMKTAGLSSRFPLDAPGVVLRLLVGGVIFFFVGIAASHFRFHPAVVGTLQGSGLWMLVAGALMVLSSVFGKRLVTQNMLRSLHLQPSEVVLDVGCGRGVLLIECARQLTQGRATGIDLWSVEDQAWNSFEATLASARRAGTRDRINVDTGDMRDMPYEDNSFDVVVSSLAVHNLPNAAQRASAIGEIARVLRPGGRLALLDFRNTREYLSTLRQCGFTDVRRSWPNPLMFPPVRVVRATRPRQDESIAGDKPIRLLATVGHPSGSSTRTRVGSESVWRPDRAYADRRVGL